MHGWNFSGNLGSIPASGGRQLRRLQEPVGPGADGKGFAPHYADIGTGESKLTGQLYGAVGHAFQWGDMVAAWRYLDYEMKSSKAIQTISFNGPSISAVFRW